MCPIVACKMLTDNKMSSRLRTVHCAETTRRRSGRQGGKGSARRAVSATDVACSTTQECDPAQGRKGQPVGTAPRIPHQDGFFNGSDFDAVRAVAAGRGALDPAN